MECLNLDEVDVDDLERRLELAPTLAAVPCPSNNPCSLCTSDISWTCN